MARLKSIFRKSEKPTPDVPNNQPTPQVWEQPGPQPNPAGPPYPLGPPYPTETRPQMRFTPMKRAPKPSQSHGYLAVRPSAPTKVIKVTSEELYSLRELMRTKYMHDVDVWSMRKAVRANIKYREEAQRKSDNAMSEIRRRVADWEYDPTWEPEERKLVQNIQRRLGMWVGSEGGDGLSSAGGSSAMFEQVSATDVRYA